MASCCLHLTAVHPPPSGSGPVVFFLGTTSSPLSLHTAQEGVGVSPTRVTDRSGLGSEHIPSPGPRIGSGVDTWPKWGHSQTCAGTPQGSQLLSTGLADMAEWKPRESWGLSLSPHGVTLTDAAENRESRCSSGSRHSWSSTHLENFIYIKNQWVRMRAHTDALFFLSHFELGLFLSLSAERSRLCK